MLPTISEFLQLAQKNNLAHLDAELIIAHILKKPREFVLTHPEYVETRSNASVLKIKKLINLRAKNVPFAYLTGQKEFYGWDFVVNKNVLIPRPETEALVDKVTEEIRKLKNKKIILIDVGTGSGCIPIAILKNFEMEKLRNLETFAIDISNQALTVAKANAKKHGVKIKFLQGDLLSPIPPLLKGGRGDIGQQKFQIIITANLPYLTPLQLKSEPSIKHEPKLALVAGKDGLKYYRQLLKQIKTLVTSYQLLVTLFLEIDPQQSNNIKKLIKQHLPHAKITIHQDLSEKDRVVEIKI